jgi:ferrous iron transport protein B
VDLPGSYSLTSYTRRSGLTREYIMDSEVDVIVNVVDASSLERNLYLTLQLIELGKPVVLALNMMDIVEERGMEIDLHRLPEMLGIPVIPVSARRKTGLDILMHTVSHHKDKNWTIILSITMVGSCIESTSVKPEKRKMVSRGQSVYIR